MIQFEYKCTAEDILNAVAVEAGITLEDMKSENQTQHLAFARNAAALIISVEFPYYSENHIGSLFNRERTTTHNGIKTAKNLFDTKDKAFMQLHNNVINHLKECLRNKHI